MGLILLLLGQLLTLRIGNITDSITTYVVQNDNFSYDLLLGTDGIKQFRLIQDENLRITQRTKNGDRIPLDAPIPSTHHEKTSPRFSSRDHLGNVCNPTEPDRYVEVNFNEYLSDFQADLSHITEEDKKIKIYNLLDKYKHIFAKHKFDIGRVKSKEAEIKVLRDEYVTSRPYRCSMPDDEEIRAQIKQLLEAELIEESDSPFASPVTLALKKEDGKRTRLCIDFRKLNKHS